MLVLIVIACVLGCIVVGCLLGLALMMDTYYLFDDDDGPSS